MNIPLVLLLVFVANFTPNTPNDYDYHNLHQALWQVESAKQLHPADGDNGRAIGPFQIWWVYWQDAYDYDKSLGGTYEDCRDYYYALKVMHAYWSRWVPDALRNHDYEVLSRVHNGGPRGHHKEATMGYWYRVK